ncbi:MAG: PfkB family carbohydrate kinase [Pisciglobus halotolerans]|nr:PfkB family carbohydrate kinase [Pisciglobus halotolerans]
MALNDKESRIIELIRDNPFISQKELSELIGLSRSAIANMISGLVKKGYLLGKPYVINDNRPVVCIGAANIDTQYKIQEQLYFNRTNDVQTEHSLGGVARNIAETLGRLETDVKLLSVVGNDMRGKNIRTSSKYVLDLRDIEMLEKHSNTWPI